MKSLNLALLSGLLFLSTSPCNALPIDGNIFFDGANTIQVAWNATLGKIYRLQTSTNLFGAWQDALSPPGTLTATNNQVFLSLPANSAVRFYRVTQLDTDGPEVYQVSPLDGAIAVSQTETLQAWLRDETGVNTNTITLAVGTNAPVSLSNPRLHYANGILTYTPGTNEVVGLLGSNVTVRVSVTDTLGNQTTNFSWSFQIALPTVPSTNILFIPGTGGFVLISTNGDYFTFSYTGPFPGLTNGEQLVNTNLSTGYTRTVVAFTNYPASNTVVVLTRPTKLAELLQLGSVSGANFTELGGQSNAAAPFRLRGATGPRRGPARDFGIGYTFELQRVLYQDANLVIELLPGSQLAFSADLGFSASFNGLRLRQFESTITGMADFTLEAHVGAAGSHDQGSTNALIQPIHKFYAGFVGALPVWVEIVFEVNAGYDLHLEASADYTNGIRATKEIVVGRRWNDTQGWSTIWQDPPVGFSVLGPRWQVQASGNLHVFLEPKLTLYLYSVAGVWGDVQPYADLEGHLQLNPFEWELALYGGLTSTIGLDLRGWDDSWGDLPNVTFDLIPRTLLWETNSHSSAPQISVQPQPQAVPTGGTATFTVQAAGVEPLSYRWQRNGLYLSADGRITGTHGNLLRIANAQISDAGNYRVLVSNPTGSASSQGTPLTVYPASIPFGVALIPAGSFTMGDTFNELDTDDQPTHAVYVSAFYMDRYEVTKSLWDVVKTWNGGNGYSYANAGSGKAANHPVHTINWYDMVKWCNARSQKEGLTPCYYTDAGLTVVFKSGQGALFVKWNANGYRLPTEAEWEKAARGGSAGHHFPWSNVETITHSRANYYSSSSDPYDISPTRGYHPTFNDGVSPYTSPAGYFAANGYGIYDMAGNMWEWCWDWYSNSWYGNAGATQNDTRGPASGSERVLRGGSWHGGPDSARCADRYSYQPPTAYDYVGFRCVRGL